MPFYLVKETPPHLGYIDYASGYCLCHTSDGTVPGLTQNALTADFFFVVSGEILHKQFAGYGIYQLRKFGLT